MRALSIPGAWVVEPAVSGDHRGTFHELFRAETFEAVTDEATVVYLCSTGYAPGHEHGVHPFDPELGIAWPDGPGPPVLSAKDRRAPSLTEARARGLLPSYRRCAQLRPAGRATGPATRTSPSGGTGQP
ncbi:hypothetical protein GCM10011578_073550 [Streptomyces fuscichromogenes]|uniref:dTDP-4-dehydrorhamnose 3,5-epimerase n=1 Tax=Streptomyces fuscichromogenes TaxID=1324013 RepID=A0A917XJR3_9ACTN|nr:dTDP-4-dehydrorhamnose 3,5-epimerase family protein [Streptomyces fuscichromogenes]GGN33613.1 hypothetical protein GCM10011578_073550 [Streptomyces fuscichromogenes]